MKPRKNPAWTQTLLKSHWDALAKLVDTKWMPMAASVKKVPGKNADGGQLYKTTSVMEYGTGHYGTVMPTNDPRVVIKITSDKTEARFVAIVLTFKEQPLGIVRYHRIVQLPGAYRKRPVFAIWRQSAENVGNIGPRRAGDAYDERLAKTFLRSMVVFQSAAGLARDVLKRAKDPQAIATSAAQRAGRRESEIVLGDYAGGYMARTPREVMRATMARYSAGAPRLAYLLELLDVVSGEVIAETDYGYLVGRALNDYLHRGLLLADVHDGNLGMAEVEEYSTLMPVITDPGHAVILTHAYDAVTIPTL
jgi:hypothetical protein